MIEKHYSAFIRDAADLFARRAVDCFACLAGAAAHGLRLFGVAFKPQYLRIKRGTMLVQTSTRTILVRRGRTPGGRVPRPGYSCNGSNVRRRA